MANYNGTQKNTKWMSKDGISKMVKPEKVDEYLSNGWHFGHDTDHQKEDNKKYYNNGKINILLKEGEPIPEGFIPGMKEKRPGGYSKFNYVWYTNGQEQKRLSLQSGDIIPEGWVKGYSEPYKKNMSKVLQKKGNFHLNNKEYTEEYKELYHNKEKLEEFISNNNQLTLDELAKRFNCTIGSVTSLLNSKGKLQKKFDWYNKGNITSSLENAVITYLKEIIPGINIVQHDRTILNGKEIDIYLPEYKVGIECNGTYWHRIENKYKKYHEDKAKLAEKAGIRLIQLWDWEILDDKIKSLLKIALNQADKKIYARNCEIRLISNSEAKSFNNNNHLQNHRNAQVTYGLFYKDELVQLMSFSKTKYNKNLTGDNDWEIIRGCPGSNNIVVGGVSKLFKHFIKEYNPDHIFSYCDFNKFDGRGYSSLGMKFIGYTGPDKIWVVSGQPYRRNPKKYKELKESADYIIWGAGSKKYLYSKNMEF